MEKFDFCNTIEMAIINLDRQFESFMKEHTEVYGEINTRRFFFERARRCFFLPKIDSSVLVFGEEYRTDLSKLLQSSYVEGYWSIVAQQHYMLVFPTQKDMNEFIWSSYKNADNYRKLFDSWSVRNDYGVKFKLVTNVTL